MALSHDPCWGKGPAKANSQRHLDRDCSLVHKTWVTFGLFDKLLRFGRFNVSFGSVRCLLLDFGTQPWLSLILYQALLSPRSRHSSLQASIPIPPSSRHISCFDTSTSGHGGQLHQAPCSSCAQRTPWSYRIRDSLDLQPAQASPNMYIHDSSRGSRSRGEEANWGARCRWSFPLRRDGPYANRCDRKLPVGACSTSIALSS